MDINVKTTITAPGMAAIEETSVVSVESRSLIEVSIPAAAVDLEIDVCPGLAADIKLVQLRASLYDGTNPLSYKVHLDTESPITLDYQQLYLGGQDDIVEQFDKVFVSNPHSEAVTLYILVGRDATP